MNKTKKKYFIEFLTHYDDWLDELMDISDNPSPKVESLISKYKSIRKGVSSDFRTKLEVDYFMKYIDIKNNG